MNKRDVRQRKKGAPEEPVLVADQPLDAKRWKGWSQRVFYSWVLVLSFIAVVLSGHLYISLLVIFLQSTCFYEVVSTAFKANKASQMEEVTPHKHTQPFFRSINWYFLFCADYFLYGAHMAERLHELFPGMKIFLILSKIRGHHNFISFTLYTAGLVFFVLTLRSGTARRQFSQFGWTHVTCLILTTCARLMLYNLEDGLIWFLLPVFIVICNDVFAYIFGFFFGRTRLIKLSPKKTWEGFIGGFFVTLIFGFYAAGIFAQYDYFRCPAERFSPWPVIGTLTCTPGEAFILQSYAVPKSLHGLLGPSLELYPAQIHGFFFAIFGSSIAPFGGFMASGFKRAFKVKDFGDVIPGHGGVTDRFDCQFLMSAFVFVYHQSFIQGMSSISFERLLELVIDMDPSRKVDFYQVLR
eukprot:Ihof_evm4s112 gene=Ihof_evmTU4s112